MKEFSAPAGIEVGFNRQGPAIGPGIRVDQYATRTLGAMAPRSNYDQVRAARGMAYYLDLDGNGRPNPNYLEVGPRAVHRRRMVRAGVGPTALPGLRRAPRTIAA